MNEYEEFYSRVGKNPPKKQNTKRVLTYFRSGFPGSDEVVSNPSIASLEGLSMVRRSKEMSKATFYLDSRFVGWMNPRVAANRIQEYYKDDRYFYFFPDLEDQLKRLEPEFKRRQKFLTVMFDTIAERVRDSMSGTLFE